MGVVRRGARNKARVFHDEDVGTLAGRRSWVVDLLHCVLRVVLLRGVLPSLRWYRCGNILVGPRIDIIPARYPDVRLWVRKADGGALLPRW